jgi:long-subunit acyl-CoA synthetase (AMP-forming)
MTTTRTHQATTICDTFAATVAARADQPALRTSDGAAEWTWREYGESVEKTARGLAGIGVRAGDTVALWLSNRPEFHFADTAALQLGAVPFSVYPTFTAEQGEHVIRDAGSEVLITEAAFLDHALAVLESGRTQLGAVVLVDGSNPAAMSWEQLLAAGSPEFDVAEAAAAVRPEDLATLIYTSGTTGAPKGVELTHANVVAQVAALSERLAVGPGWRAISWLPMAHIAERLCTHYMPMALGSSVTCLANAREIAALLPAVRPEFFFSPPRLWEKLRAGTIAGFGASPNGAEALAALGLDQVRVAVVGAAPCPPEVVSFWHRLGLPLNEVYGMSETTGVATVNPPDDIRPGTVGTALPGVELKLADFGEILIRGDVVMRGYRNQPEATAGAIDAEGWLHSGDVGEIDGDGYLRIVDRIKELIINAAGKNMSPTNIEATLKTASPLIGNVVVIGDGRPYNTALILLDPDVAAAQMAEAPDAFALVQQAVDDANTRLARVEQIKRFRILEGEWRAGGDELTPTMKLKRRPIAEKYAAVIEELYTS